MSGKFTIEVTEQWLYVNSVYGLSASSYFGETSEKIIIWEFSQMADPSSIGKPLLKFVFFALYVLMSIFGLPKKQIFSHHVQINV